MSSRVELERHVGDLAHLYSWTRHHARTPGIARDGHPDGFPGEALIREGRLVFLTVATSNGGLTPRETAWVHALGEVRSVEVHVVSRRSLRAITRLLQPREAT